VQEIISIQREETQYYNKTYAEVITKDNQTIMVTFLQQEGQAITVVNVES
jgi:hypothetical protein